MNYEEALKYIHSFEKFGSNLGLERINALLELLGSPEQNLKFIHIGGTNGKGSHSKMLSAILEKNGYSVGLYISPYIEDFRERIQINNKKINMQALAYATYMVKEAIEKLDKEKYGNVTEFEAVTAIGFLCFKFEKVEVVVLEVGLGGRLDATNVIKNPLISIITNIGYDHMEQLGNDIKLIAKEKAGIIKENSCVVLYPLEKEIADIFVDIGKERNSKVFLTNKNDIEILKLDINKMKLRYNKENRFNINEVELSLIGINQANNLLAVLKALEILEEKGFAFKKELILEALKEVRFPARFEVVSNKPCIILDGAHNIQGINSFVDNIKLIFNNKKIILFFGMLKDKQVDESIKKLALICEKIYTLTPNNPRALKAEELQSRILKIDNSLQVQPILNICDINDILIGEGDNNIFAFVGSLYLMGDIKRLINKI